MSIRIGNAYYREGNYKKAIEAYRSVPSTNGLYNQALYNIERALVKIEQNKLEKENICIVCPVVLGIHKSGGGIATAMTNLAVELADQGNTVTLLYTQHPSYESGAFYSWQEKFDRLFGIKFVGLEQDKKKHFGSHQMKRSYFISRYLENNRFGYVIFPDFHGPAYFSCMAKKVGALWSGTKIIINLHGNSRLSFWKGYKPRTTLGEMIASEMERESIVMADAIVSPSKDYLDFWKQHSSTPAMALVIPNVNKHGLIEKIRGRGEVSRNHDFGDYQQEGIKHYFYFSRLERRKGLDLFLQFAIDNTDKDSFYWLYGNSIKIDGLTSEDYIERRLGRQNIKYKILTNKTFPEFSCHIKAVNGLFVYPTLWENSPCTVVEVAQASVRMISSDIPGIIEMLDDSSNDACLFTTGCHESLKNKIAKAEDEKLDIIPRLRYPEKKICRMWKEGLEQVGSLSVSANVLSQYGNDDVSVIIPTIGRVNTLKKTLDAFEKQTVKVNEIIVVYDGNSIPENLTKLTSEHNAKLISPGRVYKGKASNLGARQAKGTLLVFFDDDDIPIPGYIDALIRAANLGNYDLVSSFQSVIQSETMDDKLESGLELEPEYISMALGGKNLAINIISNYLAKGCFAISRDAFEQVGGYQEDKSALPCVDYRFFMKLVVNKLRIGVIPRPIYAYRKNSKDSLFAKSSNPSALYQAKQELAQLVAKAEKEDLAEMVEYVIENYGNPKFQ